MAEPQGDADDERMQAIASLSVCSFLVFALLAAVVFVAAVLIVLFLVGVQVIPIAPG
jgi:hypothetical protein